MSMRMMDDASTNIQINNGAVEETVYKRSGKATRTFDGKKYVKFVDDQDVEGNGRRRVDSEGDDEEALIRGDEKDSGCCNCFSQSRNLVLGGIFSALLGISVILLEYVAHYLDTSGVTSSHANTIYVRWSVCILSFVRIIQSTNLLMLAATVKRNAIHVYPWLVRYHTYLILTCIVIHGVDAGNFFMASDLTLSWLEYAILGINCVHTVHCLLVVFHQYTNGTMDCNNRGLDTSVDGDVVEMEVVRGYERLKICDNNTGPILTEIPEDFYEFSLV